MIRYNEKRGEYRKIQKTPLLVQEINDIYIYNARMVNYSDKGLYLETDTALDVGKDIIIGIEDSTSISPNASPDSPKLFYAKIIWQKNLIGGFFNFGYGTQFIYFNDKQKVKESDSMVEKEYRKHTRKSSSKPVFLKSINQSCKGLISNISRSGAFIETQGKFKADQIIGLLIPGSKLDQSIKLKARVVHLHRSGIGIIFKRIYKKKSKPKFSPD